MRRQTLAQLRSLGFRSYRAYLLSDLWKANKARLKLRKSCWVCRSRTDLHAHHASYLNIGREQPGDVVVLCKTCHRGTHNLAKHYRLPLETAHTSYKAYKAGTFVPTRKPVKKKRRKRM